MNVILKFELLTIYKIKIMRHLINFLLKASNGNSRIIDIIYNCYVHALLSYLCTSDDGLEAQPRATVKKFHGKSKNHQQLNVPA